eukprot:CAMPEP_0172693642 /NCGR_PEP_ID=MMETSP1074-20121228/26138_1 /TAXON_ID=2916 /ORGANISM="Ceratium fusus, Strain PA161109" /LENGTH=54 /DNA_ID=CAMNT_0013514049 /DNA_START=211 /DNA_END=375 /DNA_ORIENTATION=+
MYGLVSNTTTSPTNEIAPMPTGCQRGSSTSTMLRNNLWIMKKKPMYHNSHLNPE